LSEFSVVLNIRVVYSLAFSGDFVIIIIIFQ